MASLSEAIEQVLGSITELRHDIHRHPEPAFEEVETQKRIRSELGDVGIEAQTCARTGLVADLGRAEGNRTIAIRADIDCLRMTEENADLPYRSQRPGYAHMCGHDGHTAMLVGAARLLAARSADLGGRVRLLFQPAEEGPGGAPVMIEEGALDGVDEVYGLHNWPNAPAGQLRVISGPIMAHVCTPTIVVHGKGGHASQPHATIDPVVIAAHIITALQTVVSRSVHYEQSAVVSMTMIHGGEVHNVIPDSVTLTGSIRVLEDEVYDVVERRMREIASGIAAAFGGTCTFDFDRMYPVLVNHPDETEHIERVGRRVLGDDAVSAEAMPILAAEDFSYFTRERPGCFFFLGGAAKGRTNSMCHAIDYDFNDDILRHGIEMWVRLVEDRLGTKLYD